jgi:hypothetical protein
MNSTYCEQRNRHPAIRVLVDKCWRGFMRMWSRNSDVVAAWVLVVALVVAIGIAPWEKLRASHPAGVVDVTQPRFDVHLTRGPGGLHSEAADERHDLESRFSTFGPEGP